MFSSFFFFFTSVLYGLNLNRFAFFNTNTNIHQTRFFSLKFNFVRYTSRLFLYSYTKLLFSRTTILTWYIWNIKDQINLMKLFSIYCFSKEICPIISDIYSKWYGFDVAWLLHFVDLIKLDLDRFQTNFFHNTYQITKKFNTKSMVSAMIFQKSIFFVYLLFKLGDFRFCIDINCIFQTRKGF